MKPPKISIITVCFNAEKYIEQTILSVIQQNFGPLEYLIIDGDSTDGTMLLINKYRDRIQHIVSEPDTGIYDAMNKGLALASGEYVLFINAGDKIYSSNTISVVFEKGIADIYYGETILVDEKGEKLGTRSELTTRPLPISLTKKAFLNGQPVSHQSFIVRKNLITDFNLKYQCSADIDWMIQAVVSSKKILNTKETISIYLLGGTSDKRLKKCWKERATIMLKYFDPLSVLVAHIHFAFRYLRYGAYKLGKI